MTSMLIMLILILDESTGALDPVSEAQVLDQLLYSRQSNSNSDFLPPVQDDEFLPPISRWTTFGGLFIVCAVGLAIPLASVAKYKETVKAQAVVRPAGELRLVQAVTAGPVKQIAVKQISG